MKIAVLLSGGVDSSVALRRLQEEGHQDLTAFYLKIWLEDELSFLGECPWEDDLRFAREICESAGVPLEIVPLQTEYYQKVVSYAVKELEAGRTPSPDIFCNQRIKFGAFLEKIDSAFDKVATGHYARIDQRNGHHHLLKGVDPVKDQTYFLSHLSQEQVARSLFPIGELPKSDVRRLAETYELPNAERADSQGICFLGKIKFNDFVRHHLGERLGDILELETDRKLGDHRGYWFHTIGQRKGLGLSGGPWYVVRKDLERNIVFVSHAREVAKHTRRTFQVTDAHWIVSPPTREDLHAKLRHSEHVYSCRLRREDDLVYTVELDEPDQGVASGQFAVFYDGEECLGGARIV